MIKNNVFIHESVTIGENCNIDYGTIIKEDVIIGNNCEIGAYVVIYPGTRIGDNCKIYQGASIGNDPQDLKYKGEKTYTYIGNNNIIREYVTIHRGTNYSNCTKIGNNILLMAYSHIAHDCIIDDYSILANGVQIAGHVHIYDHVVMGGLSAVLQYGAIGSYAMICGGTTISKDIPPFLKISHYPNKICGLNTVGLMRNAFSHKDIAEIKRIFKEIYKSPKFDASILDLTNKNHVLILKFIENSKLGIIRRM